MYKKNIYTEIILFLIILSFFCACLKKEDVKSNIPDLTWKDISMTGGLALNNPITFKIADTIYLGLGRTILGDNKYLYWCDFETYTWNGRGSLPFPGDFREEGVAFVIGEKAYVGLGFYMKKTENGLLIKQYYNDFYVYDNVKREWKLLEFEFPGKARRVAVAFSLGGKGYVGTGLTEDKECLRDFYEFDPEKGWTKIADMPAARWGANTFVANGSAYVCFGNFSASGNNGNWDIQKFNPRSKTWEGQPVYFEDKDTLLVQKTNGVLSFVLNKDGEDFVYFLGGDSKIDGSEESLAWGFNPRMNMWKRIGKIESEGYAFSMKNRGYVLKVDSDGVTFCGKVFDFAQ